MQHPEDGDTAGPTAGGHPDEGTIHAWLDGELSAAEASAFQQHLDGCADCRAAVAEARGLVAASRRILQALDEGPGGIHALPTNWPASAADAIPAAAAAAGGAAPEHSAPAAAAEDDLARRRRLVAHPRRRWRVPAIAAVALVAAGTTLVVQRSGSPPSLTDQRLTAPETVAAPVEPPSPPMAAADELARPEPTAATGGAAAQPTIAADRSTNMERALTVRRPPGADAGASPEAEAARGAELKQAPPIVRPPSELAGAVAAATTASPSVAAESMPVAAPAAPPPVGARALGARAGLAAESAAPQSRLAFQADAAVRQVGTTVAGRVLGGAGEPLADARVTIADIGRGAPTDAAGRFRLADLPAGDHWMLIQRQGFQPLRVPLRVAVGGDSVLAVSLAPAVQGAEGVVAEPGQPVPAPVPVALPPVAPGVLTDLARRLAGCYRLELGGIISQGREVAEGALPGWLHLRAAPATVAGWLAADPVVSSAGQAGGGHARWRTLPDGEVEVAWPTSVPATEVLLRVRGTGEVLTGTAALRPSGSDSAGGVAEEEVASVVFVRSVCSN